MFHSQLLTLGVSLEDGAIGYSPGGQIALANLQQFFPNRTNATYIPLWSEQSFIAKLYADISLSYTEVIASDLGTEDEYQLEDLGIDKGWRYHVCLARPHTEFTYCRGMLILVSLEL